MPVYQYYAVDHYGKKSTGFVDSNTAQAALDQLAGQGLYVIKCRASEEKKTIFSKFITVNQAELLLFFSHLKYQANMGLTLVDSLKTFSNNDFSQKMVNVINNIRSLLELGHNVHDAFYPHRKLFGSIVIQFLSLADKTGNIKLSIDNIINFITLSEKASGRIRRAFYYPAFSMLLAIIAVCCCIFLLAPQLSVMYDDLNISQNYISYFILKLYSQAPDWNVIMVNFSIMLALVSVICFIIKIKYPYWSARLIEKIPLIGSFIKNFNLWKFTLVFSCALKSHALPVEAFKMSIAAMTNQYWLRALKNACKEVEDGNSIHVALMRCPFLPRLLMLTVAVGENNNKLAEVLGDFADMIYYQLETSLKSLAHKFSISITLVTGGMLIFIVLGLFLPIYSNLLNFGGGF